MAMVVKNNMPAKQTLNKLNKNSKALSKSLKKVASGMKINSAADDASGFSISEKMRVQIRALDQANDNTQNASSLLRVADGALSSTVDIMRTMKEKAINAANDTNTDEDRAIIQKELDQFIDQVNDNANITFNGRYIFDGGADKTYSTEQMINAALYSEWIPNSLEAIKNSLGLDFANSNGVKEIGVYFSNEGGNTLAYVTNWSSGGKATELAMTVNMDFYNNLDKDDVNGNSGIPGSGYLDRTIFHELTHAVMASNITGVSNLYSCIKECAAEVVHGIDDDRTGDILTFASSGSAINSNLDKSTGAADDVKHYAGGYVMYRYMAANSGFSPADSVKQFMNSLASSSGNIDDRIDAAVAAATKGRFSSFDSMKAAMAADRGRYGSGNAETKKFLLDCCNINLDNNAIDVGSITGSDAGNRASKNAEETLPEAGSVKFWTNPVANESVIDGLTVKWRPGDRTVDFGVGGVRNWHSADLRIKDGLSFQTGTKANQNIFLALSKIDAQAMGLMDKDGKTLKVTTQIKAEAAISQLDKSINRALNQITTIGAVTSRMEYTRANLTTASENTVSAESVIRDADMAKEMTEYTKNNVLLQAAQSMLAQANQNSSGVLSLLQ